MNLAYRWFCRSGLDGKFPDYSMLSCNRHGRFCQSDILRHLFETVVERRLHEGLVGGEGFAVDASLIAAKMQARMHAMIAARDNVDEKLDELTVIYRRLHQEKITKEIVELAGVANTELQDSN